MSQSRKRAGRTLKIPGGFDRTKCWQTANEYNMVIDCQDTGRAQAKVQEGNELGQ